MDCLCFSCDCKMTRQLSIIGEIRESRRLKLPTDCVGFMPWTTLKAWFQLINSLTTATPSTFSVHGSMVGKSMYKK
ncbi:hypothetical protein P8452_13598 [Trifolium repens]|nr:hypothetical protein P8452_13598 [Trifolium repens]